MARVEKIIDRDDGSQVRIVATKYFGQGLHISVGVDVFQRSKPGENWKLLSDQPHEDWRKMPVEEYLEHGRPESLQAASQAEILKVAEMVRLLSPSPMNPDWDRITYREVTVDFEQVDGRIKVLNISTLDPNNQCAQNAIKKLKWIFGDIEAQVDSDSPDGATPFWNQMVKDGFVSVVTVKKDSSKRRMATF